MNLFLLNRPLHNYPESLFFFGGGVVFCGVDGRLNGLDATCLGTAF